MNRTVSDRIRPESDSVRSRTNRTPDHPLGGPVRPVRSATPVEQSYRTDAGVISWKHLSGIEPRLEMLRRQVASDADRSWDAYRDYKGAMCRLVGWFAEDDGLPDWMLTHIAYDVAHAAILRHW